jgi:hypothetical protein
MTQKVWHRDDIARIAAGGVILAPDASFALGVAWLAGQLNAPVQLPEPPAAVVVVIDGNGSEVAR